MNEDYAKFDKLRRRQKRDVFAAAAERLGTTPQAIEKDLWVCRTLDTLFNGGLWRQPKLFFKGGTSLSKGYGLIRRFSEDLDIVLSRRGLGIRGEKDPLHPGLGSKARKTAAQKTVETCSSHVLGRMKKDLTSLLPTCEIGVDETDPDSGSLTVTFPSELPKDPYLKPWVKIECGARGAHEPEEKRPITPYLQEVIGNRFNLTTPNVTLISAERTFLEKALILHGIHCGYRDENRRPGERNLISRHYYDVAMMRESDHGIRATANADLLRDVRDYKLLMFRRAWEKLQEAEAPNIKLVPQEEIQADLRQDYEEMTGMMFGDPPTFDWVLEEIAKLEDDINARLA